MTNTFQLGLPLLQPSQAQKHVTVNEALARLDGLVQLALQSQSLATPPMIAGEGQGYAVPVGAVNAWAGQAGKIAVRRNGGWDFVTPLRGWRAFIHDEGGHAIFDGAGWRTGQQSLSPANAGLSIRVIEFDHLLGSGNQSLTGAVIPANAVVFGVTARVIAAISGSLADWSLGNPGATGRYGSGLGLGVGSFAKGVLGQPTAFYAPTELQFDANGGAFAGGTVRLAVHLLTLEVPDP